MRYCSQFVRVAGLGCVVLLAGCHKRVRVATPPLPPPTLPAEPMPTTVSAPPAEAPAPTPPTIPTPAAPEPTPAPVPRAARRPAAPAPKPAAPAPQPSLGNLSEGGAGNNPGDLRAQTQTMLAEIDKRVKDLSADEKQQKRQALAQVQQFEQQARDALNHGDPSGANNLATKGKLLLEDTLK